MSRRRITKRLVAGAALSAAIPAAAVVARTKLRGDDTRERTRDELYREAQRLDIKGRSRMTKAQLERAVSR